MIINEVCIAGKKKTAEKNIDFTVTVILQYLETEFSAVGMCGNLEATLFNLPWRLH
jgi:hypothetical protein